MSVHGHSGSSVHVAVGPAACGAVARAWSAARSSARRHRRLVTVAGSLGAAALIAMVLGGRRDEFAAALSSASVLVLLLAALLQVVALLSRTEAWHGTISAAGGTVDRRLLYRASSVGYVASILNSQVAVAARIAALRRSAPTASPGVSTLIAAEFPILAVEATLAALTSFTLVGPLGLPWWLPIICVAVVVTLSAGLRHLSLRKGRELWKGLAVLRSMQGGRRLTGLVLIAVFAQILRNWMLLHAVGVDASLFDAIAVLIAMVSLSQLPIGPTVGAAAAVLILGHDGVAGVAAAGVLATVTGTIGGLAFAAWAGADRLWVAGRPTGMRVDGVQPATSWSRGQHAGPGPTAAESVPGALEATGPRRTAFAAGPALTADDRESPAHATAL